MILTTRIEFGDDDPALFGREGHALFARTLGPHAPNKLELLDTDGTTVILTLTQNDDGTYTVTQPEVTP